MQLLAQYILQNKRAVFSVFSATETCPNCHIIASLVATKGLHLMLLMVTSHCSLLNDDAISRRQ